MNTKKITSSTAKIALPLCLGGAILYWMYRGFDFKGVEHFLSHDMDWTWMLLSLPFGVLAQMFRGWRWKLALEPINEHPRSWVSVNAVFMSYALSLVVPRVGEFARCGILSRYDNVSFSKALGTVVTERAIDTVIIMLITALAFVLQVRVFGTFFSRTGTRLDTILGQFSTTGWLVTFICGIAAAISLYLAMRKLTLFNKVKEAVSNIWQGIASLRNVDHGRLYMIYSVAIWICYFLHFYLTFFCFDFTSNLGITCALVSFVVGSIAVIVPTPNGAGPWHFAVKTMLILYGIGETHALYFVLIVHTIQTLLVALLGIMAWIALGFTRRRKMDIINPLN